LSIHLDGNEKEHDRVVVREGTHKEAVAAIRLAKQKGFRVNCNTTIFDGVSVEEAEEFFDSLKPLGVDGITVSSGYHYQAAPDQEHFLARRRTHAFFEKLLSRNRKGRWNFNHSILYLEFLQGKRDYDCTPWGNPNYSVLGWQQPCYLLDEGYVPTFAELMENTAWEKYGHRNNPKCADCTAHCGYEPTAVEDSTRSLGNMLLSLKTVFR
jgi:hopanoid biosynthesis associated radical SAM protein HpnH